MVSIDFQQGMTKTYQQSYFYLHFLNGSFYGLL